MCLCPVHFLLPVVPVVPGAVLPLDRELETALFHRLDAKRCVVCGALFTPGSNRAKYCPECAVQVRRRKEAERQRKRYHLSTHLGAENPL